MPEEDRSVEIGGMDGGVSPIITGDRNTATITITNYYYRENITGVPVESTDTADEILPCPYRGLFHFGPDDAAFFFGREVFVEELFAATQTRKFIPVLGASGSGKSSVVLAGLVPKLQQVGHWKFTHFRPGEGDDPFHALALALVPLFLPHLFGDDKLKETRKIAESLRNEVYPLSYILTEIQHNYPQERVLLIADQFEELYTLCPDQKVRHHFLDTLLAYFQSSPDNTNVLVATMRADFLGNALVYPPFGDLLKTDIKLIRSMNSDELFQVVAKPADKLGVTFEVGLVERILDDVDQEPGNLPLLEFALTELWKQRQGKQLTHVAYQQIGKVQGALARHADQNYSKLSGTEKEQVRRIFIQLVQPGEGTQDTRRLATKAELSGASWELVKQLADARLVVTNRNAAEQETIEIVHEALIGNWVELQHWMNEDRRFRTWQERLRFTMAQWQELQQDEGVLLRGAVLKEAETLLKQRSEDLSNGEKEFIQASVALRQRGQRRIYYGLGGVGILSLLLMGMWGWLNYIPPGQLTHIRWKLTHVNQEKTSASNQLQVAVALVKDEQLNQALKVAKQIQDSGSKADALSAIVEAIGKLNQPQEATPLLKQAIDSANQIQYSYSKADALRAIAEAYGKLNQPQEATSLLKQAIDSANQIQDSASKADALSAIAEAYGKLNQPQEATSLLKQAIDSTNKNEDYQFKGNALSAIAEAIGKLNQPQEATSLLKQAIDSANQIQDSSFKAIALSAIAEAIGKLNQPQEATSLLKQAIDSANQIQDSYYKADALSSIVEAIGKLNQPQEATPLLKQAIDSANQIQEDSSSKANALSSIAEAYGKLNQPQEATPLLKQAIDSANQIQDSQYKADALRAIAEAYGKLNQPQEATPLLKQAIDSANQIQNYQYKANALSAIAEAIGKLNQPQEATPLLKQAIDSANQIESDFKADALSAIAEAIGKLNQPQEATPLLKQAIDSANQIQASHYKDDALSAIAEAIGKLNQPQEATLLLKQAIDSANQIQEDSSSKANALSAIAEAIGKLNQPQEATPLLKQAIASANQIQDSQYKANALRAIAEAYGKLNQPQEATPLLKQAIDSANQIQDSGSKADALSAIAEAAANQKNWGQALKVAQKCPDQNCEVSSLAKVLTVHAEQQRLELKEEENQNEE